MPEASQRPNPRDKRVPKPPRARRIPPAVGRSRGCFPRSPRPSQRGPGAREPRGGQTRLQAAHRTWTRVRNQHEKAQFPSALRKAKGITGRVGSLVQTVQKKPFELAKWHKKPPPGGEPPLSVGEQEIAAPQEKVRAFLAHLLGKATQEAEEPEEGPARTTVPLDLTIYPGDLEECLITAKNTAPGEDQITTAVIKSLWNCLHGPLKAIYEASIRLGYYPKPFRKAKVIMLTKSGRRDLIKINSYRPISLLMPRQRARTVAGSPASLCKRAIRGIGHHPSKRPP